MSDDLTLPTEEEFEHMSPEEQEATREKLLAEIERQEAEIDRLSIEEKELQASLNPLSSEELQELTRYRLTFSIFENVMRIHTPPLWNDEEMSRLKLGITSLASFVLIPHHRKDALRGFFCCMLNVWCDEGKP